MQRPEERESTMNVYRVIWIERFSRSFFGKVIKQIQAIIHEHGLFLDDIVYTLPYYSHTKAS